MTTAPGASVTTRPGLPGLVRSGWFLPVALATASLVVSAVRIARPSFWLDEAATVSMVQRSPAQMLDTLQHIDLVHGLYYLLLRPWAAVAGTSEVALRTPSAIALAVACVGFVLLVREVSGGRVAAVAGVAFVLLPGLSWTGIEARSYVLVVALVVWAVWALHRALRRRQRRWWVLFTVLVVLSVLVHVMAVLMVVPYLVAGRAADRLRPTAVAVAVAVAAVLPFVVATQAQVGQVSWIQIGPVELGYLVGLGQLFMGLRADSGVVQLAAAAVLALVVAALAVAALRARSGRRFAVDTAVAWVVVPTLVLALPVLAGVQLYQERYVAYAAPGACWLVGLGLTALRGPVRVRAAVGAVAVAAAAVGLVAQAGVASKNADDYRALADLAPGATSVLFATDEARGVAIAYPDRFTGITDLAAAGPWRGSGTLWGVQRPIEDLALAGRVVVYVASDPDDAHRREAEALLAAAGCRAGGSLEERRWTGTTYDCG
ncbi:mannosyltransferase [Klenkia soli]|uniref:Mannosyltransferase n=1 Tax=Klenkia soli TaxID=1052260 RepID=A0A1H0CW25_9ACTN|nr:glycosyltransferase family 39 protein [Klenkia soli]SDN62107.1 mannosyltransferase [Klenkia soli]